MEPLPHYHASKLYDDQPDDTIHDEHIVFAGSHYVCTADDCGHVDGVAVYVIPVDEFHEHYVERPRFHEHDDAKPGDVHDHDGRSITHYHWPDSVQYVAGDRVIPRPLDHNDDPPGDG